MEEGRPYNLERAQTYMNIGINLEEHETEELLEGNPEKSTDYNKKIFLAVHHYIDNTGRFRK